MKRVVLLVAVLLLGGCSHFTINGTICDQVASEPNTQALPKECQKYNEEKANKAFFKEQKKKDADVEDMIKFQKKEKK